MKDKITNFVEKFSEITKSLQELIDNEGFKESLSKARTIGALVKIGIDIYSQVKDGRLTEEQRAFYSFISITFESAKQSIPADIMDNISVNSAKNKSAKEELFRIFTETKTWGSYLPNHPTIVRFRTLICDILKHEEQNHLVRDFVFKFNITLEEKADNDPRLREYKTWSAIQQNLQNLVRHLEYTRSIVYQVNTIDNKYLQQYYVENNALLIENEVKSWGEDDSFFLGNRKYTSSKASVLILDSADKKKKRYTLVGAPFGIGKTSLSVYLASILATSYLDNSENIEENYIPVFVPLKDKLRNIGEEEDTLDSVLERIAPTNEGKKRIYFSSVTD